MIEANKVAKKVADSEAILFLLFVVITFVLRLFIVFSVGSTAKDLRDRIEIVNEIQKELVEKMDILNKTLIMIPYDKLGKGEAIIIRPSAEPCNQKSREDAQNER